MTPFRFGIAKVGIKSYFANFYLHIPAKYVFFLLPSHFCAFQTIVLAGSDK